MRITSWIVPILFGATLTGCIDQQDNLDTEQTSSVTFTHELNAAHQRSLNFDNAPYEVPGTTAELVGNEAGPFDLSGANILHFDIHITDNLGSLTILPVHLDNTTGGAPAATTQNEIASAITAATGGYISVGVSPLTLTVSGPGNDQNGGTLELITMTETGLTLSQLGFIESNRLATGIPDTSTADYLFTGIMTAQSVQTSEIFNGDWNVYIDNDTQQVFSNSAMVLPADEYVFNLLVSKDGVDYTGSAQQTVAEGDNQLSMDLFPIIGDLSPATTATQFTLNSTLTRYEINYVEAMPHFDLGISVDGGPEQLINIGTSQNVNPRFYIDLNDGNQHIKLNLYDGPNLIGTSRSVQENQVVVAGDSISMDIIPITGTAEFSLSSSGGDANVNLFVPVQVLDEVGGVESNLGGLLSISSSNYSIIDEPFSVFSNNANFIVNGLQIGDAEFSLKFVELDSGDIVASCSSDITILTMQPAFTCDLNVRKRAFIEGSLLNEVGLNVIDENGEPVTGAVITDMQENIIGITGTTLFGTPGFVSRTLPSGHHPLNVTSADGSLTGSHSVTLNTLEVLNETVILYPAP